MRILTLGFASSVFAVISAVVYTIWSTEQLLDVLEHQPGCFPPYTFMSEQVGFCREAATTPLLGRDEGLRPLALPWQREPHPKLIGDSDD